MRTLSLTTILSLLVLGLSGLDTPIGADPCEDPLKWCAREYLGHR